MERSAPERDRPVWLEVFGERRRERENKNENEYE